MKIKYVTEEEKNEANDIIKKIKEDTAKEDITIEQVNEDKDKLTAIINKLSSKIYSQQGQTQQNDAQQNTQENDGNNDNPQNGEENSGS